MDFIPLAAIPNQVINIILGGQDCTLNVYWRQDRLYLDLIANKQPIITGAICENRVDVMQIEHLNFKGTLHFFDSLGERPPHYEGLADIRWFFLYIPEGEEIPESLRW